jgi:hypothetical protein
MHPVSYVSGTRPLAAQCPPLPTYRRAASDVSTSVRNASIAAIAALSTATALGAAATLNVESEISGFHAEGRVHALLQAHTHTRTCNRACRHARTHALTCAHAHKHTRAHTHARAAAVLHRLRAQEVNTVPTSAHRGDMSSSDTEGVAPRLVQRRGEPVYMRRPRRPGAVGPRPAPPPRRRASLHSGCAGGRTPLGTPSRCLWGTHRVLTGYPRGPAAHPAPPRVIT